jgi:autophagy-related protein 9
MMNSHHHHHQNSGSSSMIQHHYHALGGNEDDDNNHRQQHHQDHQADDGSTSSTSLWDQLNDEQSREVQQHQSRFQAAPLGSRSHPLNIVWSMASQTAERVSHGVTSTIQHTKQAWREQQQDLPPRPYFAGQQQHPPDEFDLQFNISADLRPILEEDPLRINNDETETMENRARQQRQQPQTSNTESKPLKGYPFVVLQNFHRDPSIREEDTWGIPSNMDLFLTRLYQYFYHRGIVPMTCQFLVEIISLLVTLWLSRILLAYVDWPSLATCKEETTCHAHWSDYYRTKDNPLSWPFYLLIQGYTLLILAYAGFRCWSFWHSLMHATTCRTILHDKLGLSQRKLQGGALAWDDVVKALAKSQESGAYRVVLNTPDDSARLNADEEHVATNGGTPNIQSSSALDPLTVAQRIMRKDNFLIAFFNQGLLDITIGGRQYWCSSLEWSVYNCILNFMFNHKYEVRPAFCLDASSLERRFKVCGIVHLILLPFAILFVSLHFLLRHVYNARYTKDYMGNQQWSHVAHWTFREFNELPHMLEQRLEPSYSAGAKYVGLFGTSEWVAALGKLLVFLGGAVGGVLLLLGVFNDAILLHVQLWGRNLLWYAGMAGIVYSVGKVLLPAKEATPSVTRNLFEDMDMALKNVAQYTHYYPQHWKGRGWDANVYKSFKKLFDTKVKLFVYELVALVLTPYILFFQLSKCAPAICEFCLISKARMATGSGDVCGFSTFDFDTFGDEAWEGRTLGRSALLQIQRSNGESLTESIMRTGNLEDATDLHPKPRAREGKMEKSFFTFQVAHPDWKCSASGQSLVNRVEEYRFAAMTRERELHIEAAARQLETLARLEKLATSPQANQQLFEAQHLHHTYYQGQQGTADAGAGIQQMPFTASNSRPRQPPLQRQHLPLPPLRHPSVSSHHQPNQGFSTVADSLPSTDTTHASTSTRRHSDTSAPNGEEESTSLHLQQRPSHSAGSLALAGTLNTGSQVALEFSRLFLGQSALLEQAASSPTSMHGSHVGDRDTERQYYWLERFHEHLEEQQRQSPHGQEQPLSHSVPDEVGNDGIFLPVIARSMPNPSDF